MKKIILLNCMLLCLFTNLSAIIKEIPTDGHFTTNREFKDKFSKWLKNMVVEHFKSRHSDSIDKLKNEVDFLNRFCDELAETDNAENTLSLFDESLKYSQITFDSDGELHFNEDNNIDSIFYAASGMLYFLKTGTIYRIEINKILSLMRYTLPLLEEEKYSIPFRMLFQDWTAETARLKNHYDWHTEWEEGLTFKTEALKKKYYTNSDVGDRIAYFLFDKACEINWTSVLKPLIKNLKKSPEEYSPWLLNMLQGEMMDSNAWDARGRGWASSVTKDGWSNFKKLGVKSAEFYRKAWELHPEFPEAAAELIEAAMAGHTKDSEDIDFWFLKSVAAQIDYFDAYESYSWALRPRWGGTHKDMLQLGQAAYNTKLFSTNAPRFFVIQLLLTEQDRNDKNIEWRNDFYKKEVQDKINKLYSSMLSDQKISGLKRELISLEYAFCCLWMGDYEKAAELRKTISDYVFNNAWNVDHLRSRVFFNKGKPNTRNGKEFDRELAAFTGTNKELLIKWLKAIKEGDVFTEFELYDKLMDRNVVDDKTFKFFQNTSIFYNKIPTLGSVNYKNTVLVQMIFNKKFGVAEQMIKNGADINEKTILKTSPLLAAAEKGSIELVDLLLQKGADVNAVNVFGKTALINAMGNENSNTRNSLLKLLLEKKPKLDVFDYHFDSPLTLAVRNNDKQAVETLLKAGADINTHQVWAPIHFAANFTDNDMIDLLCKYKVDINALTEGALFPATEVAIRYSGKKFPVIKSLIKNGIDLSLKDVQGDTALHVAAEVGDEDIIKLLLKSGADKYINVKNIHGKLPADMSNNPEIKKLLQ
jgi:ankyrin repeat protein